VRVRRPGRFSNSCGCCPSRPPPLSENPNIKILNPKHFLSAFGGFPFSPFLCLVIAEPKKILENIKKSIAEGSLVG
jgi:hypothetical protein